MLVTNRQDMGADEVVSRYKAMADIGRSFKVLDSKIEMALVIHCLLQRIQAHASNCFMAVACTG